ncbi:MAG: NAD(P)H-hydrate dehydratase, partial [Succinivibrio sp.]
VISIDVPSGLCADTGYVPGHCVRASKTVCMLALKPGLLTGDGVDYTGEIIFESLGIDSSSYVGVFDEAVLKYPMPVVLRHYEPEINYLLERNPSSNKGDNGKVLIIAGSFGMGGAAIICGVGALRSGAGLVKVATDPKNFAPLLAVCPELMTVDINDFEALSSAIEWCDVVAAGPGLGCNERTQSILELLDDLEDKTVILDADALNVLSSYEQNYYKENRIITPHPGEAARLLATTIEEVNKDRFSAAIKLYQKYGGVVLLKGAGSIVCDGSSLRIIKEGSPALATGGSGDLLTGIIASLCGQGLSNSQSAVDSACIHGRAAQMCAKDHGIIGTLPLDLCSYIRKLVNARV